MGTTEILTNQSLSTIKFNHVERLNTHTSLGNIQEYTISTNLHENKVIMIGGKFYQQIIYLSFKYTSDFNYSIVLKNTTALNGYAVFIISQYVDNKYYAQCISCDFHDTSYNMLEIVDSHTIYTVGTENYPIDIYIA